MQMSDQEIFCHLVQIAIGTRDISEFKAVGPEQWMAVFRMAKKQGLLAVTFGTIEKLPSSLQPPLPVKMSWIRCRELIVAQNKKISALCQEVDALLTNVGVRTCVLKGQGMATYYPVPEHRNSGDIDLWVRLENATDDLDADVEKIIEKVSSLNRGKIHDLSYHHVEWTVDGVEVELHYRPGEFQNRKTDRIYQEWAVKEFDGLKMTSDKFHIPSARFCFVQLMEHMMRHIVMTEGLGMRQMCDYAVLLQKTTKQEKEYALAVIKKLGMTNLTKGVMWIMKTVFAISDDLLMIEPSKKYGDMLLENIWEGGNLGMFKAAGNVDFDSLSPLGKFKYLLKIRKERFQIAPKETSKEFFDLLKIIFGNRRNEK